jgi:hypothetical protein
MNLLSFATALAQGLRHKRIPADIGAEQDLKRRFVIPVAEGIDPTQEHILIFSPPFGGTKRCQHGCATRPPAGEHRIVGCPKCWAAMKAWGSVAAFGTHHTFDLIAKSDSKTLAVEVKMASIHGRTMPNAELQRFLGQCALAATKHALVIGFFGYQGQLNLKHDSDTTAARNWFEHRQIELVFREIGR